MILVAVLSGQVEPEVVSGGLLQEVVSSGEGLHLVQLILDDSMHCLHIGLPSMRTRRDGLVSQSRDRLNGLSKGAVLLSIPAAHKLRAVVGLNPTPPKAHSAALQIIDQQAGKQAGIGQGALLGIANKL